jgi:Tfp pilus assembly protein PilF
MIMRRSWIVSALVLCAAFSAAAQAPLDSTIRAARKLIDDGKAAEALTMLGALDVSAAGPRGQARVAFYQGRAHDQLHDPQQAVAAYERAIAVQPAYGAALNNLALLLQRQGDDARAAQLLQRAAALGDDPRRPLYLDNYAAAAEKIGQIDEARRAYAQLAAAQPDNVDAQLQSIRLLDDPRRMALQLTKLCNRGEVSAAQSLALDLLAKPFDDVAKRALLGVVAGTLAAQRSDAASSRLEKLRADPAIAGGVAEILQLRAGIVDPNGYRWWRSPAPDERFGALIRATASASEPAKAESYLRLALDYAGGTDTAAFVDLADLYYSQERIADLDALTKQYERPMFDAKRESIANADYAAEYRFHIALGTMYAYLQRWGNDHDAASAIFQLTQAGRAAADYNRTVKWGPRIANDPKTLELLAAAYEKSNQVARGLAIRVDAAAAFVAEGRKTAAKSVLKPIAADPAIIKDAAVRQRYDDVVAKLAQPMVVEMAIEFPDSVSVDLKALTPMPAGVKTPITNQISGLIATYVRAETDAERDRAEDTLRKLGVSDLDPTTMSRASGEFLVEAGGKPVRYRYTVKSE